MNLFKLNPFSKSLTKGQKEKLKNQYSVLAFAIMVIVVAYMMISDPSISEEADGRYKMVQYSQLISESRIKMLAERHCSELGLELSAYEIKKKISSGRHPASRYYHYFSCR